MLGQVAGQRRALQVARDKAQLLGPRHLLAPVGLLQRAVKAAYIDRIDRKAPHGHTVDLAGTQRQAVIPVGEIDHAGSKRLDAVALAGQVLSPASHTSLGPAQHLDAVARRDKGDRALAQGR